MQTITSIILAAGTSKRLGQAKQLVKINNETLLSKTVKALQVQAGSVLVVTGYQNELIEKELQSFSIDTVYNPDYKKGIGTSISCGVKEAINLWPNTDGFLISLCDQPLLSNSFIISLIEAFNFNPEKVITSSYSDTLGPPVIFPKKYINELMSLEGDRGAKKIISRHVSEIISLPNENLSLDIDTPDDLIHFKIKG